MYLFFVFVFCFRFFCLPVVVHQGVLGRKPHEVSLHREDNPWDVYAQARKKVAFEDDEAPGFDGWEFHDLEILKHLKAEDEGWGEHFL